MYFIASTQHESMSEQSSKIFPEPNSTGCCSLTNVAGRDDVDRVVWAEGVLGVGLAIVGDDAGRPVHGPQVQTILFDLETIGVEFAASLEDLQVGVFGHQPQVVMDEEHHLLLVHLPERSKERCKKTNSVCRYDERSKSVVSKSVRLHPLLVGCCLLCRWVVSTYGQ